MADLRFDCAALDAAAARAEQVRARVVGMPGFAHDIAALTGHGPLADRVREASDSWEASRTRLARRLERLSDALRSISETFARLDAAMGSER